MDQLLKQRLVGAVVLVSLAVIFIPVILEGPDDELIPRFQALPQAPVVDYNTSVDLPLPAPAVNDANTDAAQAVPEAGGQPQIADPESDATNTPLAQDLPPPQVVVTPGPAALPETREPPTGWYVQVGSFSQPDNADALQESLASSGFTVYVQPASAGGKPSFRVLVGPVESRASAERQQERLAGQHRLQGLVVELGER